MNPGSVAGQIPLDPMDAIIRKIQELERTIRELGPSIAQSFAGTVADLTSAQATLTAQQNKLAAQQAQLNAASESLSQMIDYTTTSTPSSQMAQTNWDAAIVTFNRPSWATKVTIITNALFVGFSNLASTFTPNLYANIDGVNSPLDMGGPVPAQAPVFDSSNNPTIYTAYSSTTVATIPFSRSFATSATSVSASLRLTKSASGAGANFIAAVAASAFWTAN